MSMTKGDMSDCLSEVWNGFEKNNYYFIYSRNMKSHDMRSGLLELGVD